METEWHHLPDQGEVMVNVTDLYGVDFEHVLAEIEREFSWTGADYFTENMGGEVEQWMFLLGAVRHSTGLNSESPGSSASVSAPGR